MFRALPGRPRVHRGQRKAAPVDAEFPAVVGTANAAVFIAAKEQVGTAMRTAGRNQADRSIAGTEGAQVLAKDRNTDRRTVALGQFGAEQDGLPEAAKQIAHRGVRAGAGQQDVVGFRQHGFFLLVSWSCR